MLHKKSYGILSEDVATSLIFDDSLWAHSERSKTDLFFVKVWGCCRVTGGQHLVNTTDLPRVKLLQDKFTLDMQRVFLQPSNTGKVFFCWGKWANLNKLLLRGQLICI